MYQSNALSYAEIRQYLDNIPVIETHEHYDHHEDWDNVLDFLFSSYYQSDFWAAGGEGAISGTMTPEEKYRTFLQFYQKSNKTAYARGLQEGLRQCWGVERLDTLQDLQSFEEKFKTRDASIYEQTMNRLGIRAKIVDIDRRDLHDYVEGRKQASKYTRFAFPLPMYHSIHSANDIPAMLCQWLGRPIISLDDYAESFDGYLRRCVDFGIVCLKDQTAYDRTIAYRNPTKAEAEKVFNDIVFNPRCIYGEDAVQPLNDWLFHFALKQAARHGLPVQIHTGHMAGIRNEIAKTNAVHLTPTLELHRDVNFALFHGNWPYMDEYLFLGKNYPNVWLDLCWVQCIDPVYCVELMKRAVMTVPQSKVFAFGGDTGAVEWVAGYVTLARDNVACALAELTDSGWLTLDEAKQVAADWFFHNPNEFYKLGLDFK